MLKTILIKMRNYFIGVFREFKIFYFLFKKENVFKYFFIIFSLMFISGIIFLGLEYDKVIAANPNTQHLTFIDKIITVSYWAIVTISTCGYGDISPSTQLGRLMVMVTLFLSIASVSLFTANLASALTTKKLMERRGIMDLSEYTDHYIICGWKKDMAKVLSEIKLLLPKLNYKKFIIIANIDADTLELFKQQYPQFDDVTILRGEYYNETLLKKANISKAVKVLIVADESTPQTRTEIDSKTIMAVMAIRSITKNVIICAELLDAEFEKYFKSTQVDEIIYSSEYNRLLLSNSISKPGVTKIVNSLLDIRTPEFITTDEIPVKYIGKKFLELKGYFKNENNYILIGLLENVGSYIQRKNEAVRKAQQTADISKLIDNLKVAKKMESNLPNINPDDEYIIPNNCLAVLVGKRE